MRSRRNDPCPCGSGVKRKKCCEPSISDSVPPELFRHLSVSHSLQRILGSDKWQAYRHEGRDQFGMAMADTEHPEAEDSGWFLFLCDDDIQAEVLHWVMFEYREKPGQPTFYEQVREDLERRLSEHHREALQQLASAPIRLFRVLETHEEVGEITVEYVDDGADGMGFRLPIFVRHEPGVLLATRFFGTHKGLPNPGWEMLRFPPDKADLVLKDFAMRHRDQADTLCFHRSYYRHVWEKPKNKHHVTLDMNDLAGEDFSDDKLRAMGLDPSEFK